MKGASISQNFYPKSFTLISRILELIQKEKPNSDMFHTLGISKQVLFYYTSKLCELGCIMKATRGSFVAWKITSEGKRFLDQYSKDNTKNNSLPICRAENIQFKADVIQIPTVPFDWKKVDMKNWKQYISEIDGIRVKLNLGKHPSLLLLPQPVEGNDPFSIFVILVFECVHVIIKLNDTLGLKVGPLQLGSRGEWLTYDPIAKVFCQTNGQVTYDGLAKVNASKPRKIGEVEFFHPQALLSYLLMPARLTKIDARTEKIQETLEHRIQNDNEVTEHKVFFPHIFFTTCFIANWRLFPLLII